jgi:hypothetical protein
LDQALDQGKTRNDFKQGDKMPEFLLSYSNTLLSRANAHPPPDELAENVYPFLGSDSHGQYTLNHSELNHDILNLLNTLYEFEKSSTSTPSKLSTWLKQALTPKTRAKSTSN